MQIDNIVYFFDEFGIEFKFKIDGKRHTAVLQLPDTGDSQHLIDEESYDYNDDYQLEIFTALCDFYFNDFENIDLAVASALLNERVEYLQEINNFYVAFTENDCATLIKESPYASYYNMTLFTNVIEQDLQIDEDEFLCADKLIEEAKSLRAA